jgi:hypothetical protein
MYRNIVGGSVGHNLKFSGNKTDINIHEKIFPVHRIILLLILHLWYGVLLHAWEFSYHVYKVFFGF